MSTPFDTPDKWVPEGPVICREEYAPVLRITIHPPGDHRAKGIPIVAEYFAVEMITPRGSRFWGFREAKIDSFLRVRVNGYSERNEIVMNWPNAEKE